jgi:hypothetical protein
MTMSLPAALKGMNDESSNELSKAKPELLMGDCAEADARNDQLLDQAGS